MDVVIGGAAHFSSSFSQGSGTRRPTTTAVIDHRSRAPLFDPDFAPVSAPWAPKAWWSREGGRVSFAFVSGFYVVSGVGWRLIGDGTVRSLGLKGEMYYCCCWWCY